MKLLEKISQHKLALDLLTVVFALVVGSLIWFYVNSRRTATREMRARLEVTMPSGWQLSSQPPKFCRVMLRGPQQVMQTLRPDDLRFTEKLTLADSGSSRPISSIKDVEIHLQADNLIGLPRDVQVVEIIDAKITFNLVRAVRKYIPVEVVFNGELPENCELKNTKNEPQYVAVTATEDDFTTGLVVKTRPIDLEGRNKTFATHVDLQPLKMAERTIELSDSILVNLTIVEKSASKIIENVPVCMLLATQVERLGGHKILPTQVTVKVEGSENLLNTLSERNITVYVDSRDMGTSTELEYTLKCRVLPVDDLKIIEIIPSEVKLQIP